MESQDSRPVRAYQIPKVIFFLLFIFFLVYLVVISLINLTTKKSKLNTDTKDIALDKFTSAFILLFFIGIVLYILYKNY